VLGLLDTLRKQRFVADHLGVSMPIKLAKGSVVGAAAIFAGLSLAIPQALCVAAADTAATDSTSVTTGPADPSAATDQVSSPTHPASSRRGRGVKPSESTASREQPLASAGTTSARVARGLASVKDPATTSSRQRPAASSKWEQSAASQLSAIGAAAAEPVDGGQAETNVLPDAPEVAAVPLAVVGATAGAKEPTRALRGATATATTVRSAVVGAAAARTEIVSRPVLSFLTAVVSALGLNSPSAPANPLGALVWGLFRRVETHLGAVPVAGTPVVGTADPVTGVVTGSLNVSVDTGLPLKYTVTDSPDDGTVVLGSDGTFTYTPTSFGTDSFTVTVSDGIAATNQSISVAVPSGTGLPGVVATIKVGSGPAGVAIAPNGAYAYVASRDGNAVSVINTATNTVTSTIGVETPTRLAVSPDGTRVYATAYNRGQLSVVDTATNLVTATINLGGSPGDIAVSPDGTRGYVITRSRQNSDDTWVAVINTDPNSVGYNTVINRIKVGGNPVGLAVSAGGSEIYVTQSRTWTVSTIEAATNTITATVGVGKYPVGVAAGARQIYVANSYQFARYEAPTLSVVSAVTDSVVATIKIAKGAGTEDSRPGSTWVATAPGDGGKIWVTNSLDNLVAVIDSGEYISGMRPTNTVTATIGVGKTPAGVAITPDGRFAYVTNSGDGTVSVISTGTQKS